MDSERRCEGCGTILGVKDTRYWTWALKDRSGQEDEEVLYRLCEECMEDLQTIQGGLADGSIKRDSGEPGPSGGVFPHPAI